MVLSRIPEGQNGVLVVASAGNTAAAFCRMCSENEIACLIVIPERALNRMLVAEIDFVMYWARIFRFQMMNLVPLTPDSLYDHRT